MIYLENVNIALRPPFQMHIPKLAIKPQQSWAFIGSNGSGKSALASFIQGNLSATQGKISGLEDSAFCAVSFEAQQELIEQEAKKDDSDITNEVWQGTPVIELLQEVSHDPTSIQNRINQFSIGHIANKGFRKLSTGESRKVILIRALLQNDTTLILDEPFDGLDANSQQVLNDILQEQHRQGRRILFILNRLDEVPDWVTHLGVLHNLSLIAQGEKQAVLNDDTVSAFFKFNQANLTMPQRDPCAPVLQPEVQTLVSLKQGKVAYSDRLIFENLNWQIERGDHWAVLGPNGCGKSTLLNLISGDHPQCYANDLTVFGIKRGSGESIWDIKRHIGIVSAALQWNYKASTNVLSTVISGLFDSIGLYSQVEEHQKNLALDWLKQIQLEDKANAPLHQLSYGEQRLVLICRAMIKQPVLLILDEPCQGLDEANRQLVLGFIALLSQQSQTSLLYVTHHQSDLLPCFDKQLICNGFTEHSGSTWEVLI